MLKSRDMTEVLKQCLSPSIDNIFLINREGSLVAIAKLMDKSQTQGAVLSCIWNEFETAGKNVFFEAKNNYDKPNEQELQCLVVQCEQGKILVMGVSVLALVVLGNKNSQVGELRMIGRILKNMLEEQLNGIYTEQS